MNAVASLICLLTGVVVFINYRSLTLESLIKIGLRLEFTAWLLGSWFFMSIAGDAPNRGEVLIVCLIAAGRLFVNVARVLKYEVVPEPHSTRHARRPTAVHHG